MIAMTQYTFLCSEQLWEDYGRRFFLTDSNLAQAASRSIRAFSLLSNMFSTAALYAGSRIDLMHQS